MRILYSNSWGKYKIKIQVKSKLKVSLLNQLQNRYFGKPNKKIMSDPPQKDSFGKSSHHTKIWKCSQLEITDIKTDQK